MAPRRSRLSTSRHTTTARTTSARCGTPYRGCTAANGRGRSPSRAIARLVRPMPAIRASSAPRAAVAAPSGTTGPANAHVPASTAAASGVAVVAVPPGPSTDSRVTATTA